MASMEGSIPIMESQNQVKNNPIEDKIQQVREDKNEIEPKILNSSNQEPDTSGDWYKDVGRNLDSILNENEGMKTTWKIRNPYSVPNSKFQTYWQDLFPDSTMRELNLENLVVKTVETNFLSYFRDLLATYQESNGTPPTEFSFVSLIKVLGEATGKSLLALIYIIVNMAPVVEIFLYILRFILDKLISIRASEDYRQMIIKSIILVIQSLSIYVCLVFIFGFIMMPIVRMVFDIMTRVMLFDR